MLKSQYYKKGIILLLGIMLHFAASSQIRAPELYCVKGDTLRWRMPVNACGPMTAYEIYTSGTQGGPYTLLATITDLSQTEFIRQNSPGGILYYYMRTVANCPGSPLSSDTLENASPQPVEITAASVSGTDIILSWSRSQSPEVVNYIIFREDPDGKITRLDTLNALTYTDKNLLTGSSAYGYYVTAVDECWVSSVFPDKHKTMVLSAVADTCKLSAVLQATPYNGYPEPIYELWQSVNGGTEQLVSSGKTAVFTVDQLMPQADYAYRIRAVGPANAAAWSNEINVKTFTGIRLEAVCITGIGKEDPASPEDIITTSKGAPLPAEMEIITSNNYLEAINALKGNKINFNAGRGITGKPAGTYYFKIITRNSCGDTITSNTVQSIALRAKLRDRSHAQLDWNNIHWENAEVKSYQLYYLPANKPEELIYTGTVNDTAYVFELPAGDKAVSYCFRIVAGLELNCDHLNAESASAWSDIACVEKTSGFYAPNAFVRNGVTPEFKPVIYFAENIQSYLLEIYDRWGNRLFSSSDPLKGWPGRKGDVDAPPGMYVWRISLSSNGHTIEQKGSLMLVE